MYLYNLDYILKYNIRKKTLTLYYNHKYNMKKSRTYKTVETEILDKETGEIVSTKIETEKIVYEKEPPFIKLYIDDIVLLNRLPEGVAGVLYDIVSNMGYNNLYIAHQTLKEISCQKLGLSLNTYNQYVSKLKSTGILIAMKGRGLYLVNPKLFAKGEWKDIKNLRLAIDYDTSENSNGKKIISSNIAEQIKQLSLDF